MTNKDKFIASLVLSVVGDYITTREQKTKNINNSTDILIELVSNIVLMGGLHNISIKYNELSSKMSFAILLIQLLDMNKKTDVVYLKKIIYDICIKLKKNYSDKIWKIDTEYGINNNFINSYEKNNDILYSQKYGTNSSAIRCIPIGLYNADDQTKLIDLSISLSKLINNSADGYLGGVTTALFLSFGINGVQLTKWPSKLIKLLESDKIKTYINNDNEDELFDYLSYVRLWKKYLNNRFVKENNEYKPLFIPIFHNMLSRNQYFCDFEKENIGGTGGMANIIAYDSVLTASGVWDRLMFYSSVHSGDYNATCIIANSFYGSLYGFTNIPNSIKNNIDEYIYKIANALCKSA